MTYRNDTVAGKALSFPAVYISDLHLVVDSEQIEMRRLPDPDDCPFDRRAATVIYLDTRDPAEAAYALGYSQNDKIAVAAVRVEEGWTTLHYSVDCPAVTFVFRDEQTCAQFGKLVERYVKGEDTHPMISPLTKHIIATLND